MAGHGTDQGRVSTDMLREALETVQGLRVRMDETERVLEGERREKGMLAREKEAAMIEVQSLRDKLSETRADLSAEESAKRNLQSRLDRAEMDASTRIIEARELTAQLAQAQAAASKRDEMQRHLTELLEQQLRDGDELVRQLRHQVSEYESEVGTLRVGLLRAGEMCSKLEIQNRDMSKSLGEAQVELKSTRRLKEEGPLRMRDYVKNVIEGLFADALESAPGGWHGEHSTLEEGLHSRGAARSEGAKPYDQMKRENLELTRKMEHVEKIFLEMADENARLAVQLDRCVNMVETGQQRASEREEELEDALAEKDLYIEGLEAKLLQSDKELGVAREVMRAKGVENYTLMTCMQSMRDRCTKDRREVANEGRQAEAAAIRLRTEEQNLHQMVEDAQASLSAVLREMHRQREGLEGLRQHTEHGLAGGRGVWENAMEQLENNFRSFEGGVRGMTAETARDELQRQRGADGKVRGEGEEMDRRILELIRKMADQGDALTAGKGKGPSRAVTSDSGLSRSPQARSTRPVSAKSRTMTSPARGGGEIHSSPVGSYVKARGGVRSESQRVLKSAKALLERTYNSSTLSASHL